jgi:hypothetical protein
MAQSDLAAWQHEQLFALPVELFDGQARGRGDVKGTCLEFVLKSASFEHNWREAKKGAGRLALGHNYQSLASDAAEMPDSYASTLSFA